MKSLYSLILNDDLIAEVDRLAAKTGSNRSATIDAILARYFGYETPEMRIDKIFRRMEDWIRHETGLRLLNQPSQTISAATGTLTYPYNPTMKYQVELYKSVDYALGELKVSSRSSNAKLLALLDSFYDLWTRLERKHLGDIASTFDNGRYTRVFRIPNQKIDMEALGEMLGAYIRGMDTVMQRYFASLDRLPDALPALEQLYLKQLESTILL